MSRWFQHLIHKSKVLNKLSTKPFTIPSLSAIKSRLPDSNKSRFSALSLQLHLPSFDVPFIHPKHTRRKNSNTEENLSDKEQIDSQSRGDERKQDDQQQRQQTKATAGKAWFYLYLPLILYSCAELLFWCRCRYLEYYANKYIPVDIVRTSISHERCEQLLNLALKYAGLYDHGYAGWLKLWFNESDYTQLCRENILELFYWGFFVENYDQRHLNTDISAEELRWREQFVWNGLMQLEQKMQHTFPDGKNEAVGDRFNNKQDVQSDYHPLALYGAIGIFQIWMSATMKYYFGFQSEYISDMKVWYKRVGAANDNALLFLHGIGIGLAPYFYVIQELMNKSEKTENQMDLICIPEIPFITMDILHLLPWPLSSTSYIMHKLPPQFNDYLNILHAMESKLTPKSVATTTTSENEVKWTIIGQSYGSMIASTIYSQIEDIEKKPRLLLIDPACFILSHPSTVKAFVTDINEVDEDEFASNRMPVVRKMFAKELMISCHLRRYFHWYELVLYPEELLNDKHKHIVVTAQRDGFVPVQLIEKGLQNMDSDEEQIIYDTIEYGHGEWIWDKECIKRVLQTLY